MTNENQLRQFECHTLVVIDLATGMPNQWAVVVVVTYKNIERHTADTIVS